MILHFNRSILSLSCIANIVSLWILRTILLCTVLFGSYECNRAKVSVRNKVDYFVPSFGGYQSTLLRLRGGKATGYGQQLQQLQYVMKKDPESYIPELEAQVSVFHEKLKNLEFDPASPHEEFGELLVFLSNMCPNFPDRLNFLPHELMGIVRANHTTLAPTLRTKMCQSLTMMCARKLIPAEELCCLFFQLFPLPDKKLRVYLYTSSLSAIKRLNAKSVDQRANRRIQRDLAALLHGEDTRAGALAITLFMELFRRRMWDDDHVVNIIGAACFSRQDKVRGSAIHFLLGIDEEEEGSEDDFGLGGGDGGGGSQKRINPNKLMLVKKHKKKALRKALKAQAREDERARLDGADGRPGGRRARPPRFAALDRLHDPQAFAERMLALLRRWGPALSADHRLLMMELVSRLVAAHRLVLFDFYDFVLGSAARRRPGAERAKATNAENRERH
jgi:protein SDA1